MPRRARCVLPGAASHVTQRGVDRRITFSDDHDRNTYLRLMRENLNSSRCTPPGLVSDDQPRAPGDRAGARRFA